jgi:ribonuclease P protein component
MLPHSFRLSDKKSFDFVFQEGQYTTIQELSFKWHPTRLSQSRVGFIASKKNFPKAHDRNRAKRLLREAFRTQLFALRPGFDIIVLYRYKLKQLRFETIAHDISIFLEKNNLLQKIL